MLSFQLVAVSHESFEDLSKLPDDELRKLGAVRQIATEDFGFPCRISLEDAKAGGEVSDGLIRNPPRYLRGLHSSLVNVRLRSGKPSH